MTSAALNLELDALDYWRLCDELSVVQAALLILGCDPAEYRFANGNSASDQPIGYQATYTALKNAILSKKLPAIIKCSSQYQHFYYQDDQSVGEWLPTESPDWDLTTVIVHELKHWLSSRGVKTGFFFPGNASVPDYLDPNNLYYAPKLAAAVRAWEAVISNESKLSAKPPKQALDKWLRENASQYGLTKEDGSPNNQGIEDVSKIANWNIKGGAPRTPSK